MNAERFRRAAELFEEARALEPHARREHLERHADDAALAAEVLALLSAHDAPGGDFADENRATTRPAWPGEVPETPALREGDLLGPYRIGARLGEGGMGTVYRATVEGDTDAAPRGGAVALKVLRPALLGVPGALERFRREASIGLRLRHPNLVRAVEVGAADAGGVRRHYLALEFVEGRTLLDLLRELGRAPEALCRHVGREVANGLAAVHAAGAVHRDVKPENVMITPPGAVLLMDLGVAFVGGGEERLTVTNAFVGSLLYAAPEQFPAGGGRVDARSDLWSLGLLLYEFASGVHPFRAAPRTGGVPRAEAPPLSEANPQVSPFLEDLVRTLLAHDPAARFQSAAEVASTLERGEASPWWRGRVRAIREATRRPLRRVGARRETALHGRGAEMAALRRAWERAAAGNGRVVLVRGEAGIGKSRLVEDFVEERAKDEAPPHVLYGGHRPGGAATATGALAAAYRDHLGDEDLPARLERLVGPALARPFAALLLGDPPPAGVAPLSAETMLTAFVRAAHALAEERAVIVVVEDLHFAPTEGRSLFAALAAAAAGRRILVAGTFRRALPEPWVADLERLEHVECVDLERLAQEPLRRILVEALGPDAAVDDLLPHVARKSDGNPYFAFEILRGLRERSGAAHGASRSASSILRRLEVPSTITDLIRARLSALTPEERALLDVAACQGHEFDPLLVADALGRDRIGVLQGFAAAERVHRLVRSHGHRVAFDHHQVHETLYADLPGPLRAAYHAALGEALEARAAASGEDEGGAAVVDVCRHLYLGGRAERAASRVERAVAHLSATHRSEGVVDLARAALAAPGTLAPARRVGLLIASATALARLGRRDEEGAAVREAIALADAGSDARARARCRHILGWHQWALGRWEESRNTFAEGLDLARRSGDPHLEAEAIGDVGGVGNETGDFEGARSAYERQFALASLLGDRAMLVQAEGNLSLALQYLGRYGEAHAAMLRTCAAGADVHRVNAAIALVNLGRLEALLGEPERGRAALTDALSILREVPELRVEGYALHRLGSIAEQTGDADEAVRLLRRALALRREIRYPAGVAETLVALGRHHLARGADDAARAHLAEAASVAREIRSPGDLVLAACLTALLPGEDAAGAVAALAEGEPRMRAGDRLEARFLLWRGAGDRAHLDEAKRVLAHLVEHAPADRRAAMLARVPLHRDVAAAG